MAAPFEAVVVGNIGIDTNIYLPGADIDFSVEANFTEDLDYVGQAGGYSSRGFAQLGRNTAFIGSVGDDYHADHIRATLAADGVDASALFIDPAGTCRSVNIMYRDGRRKNFYDGKGHMQLAPDLACAAQVLAGARLAVFHLPNWARQLLPIARQGGSVIACDLQDVTDPGDPYRQDFIASADILFCSAANFPDPAALVEPWLRARPDLIVVVGRGAQGCAVASSAGVAHYPPPPLDLPIVDSNGAGDALAVGFLTSYVLEGRSIEESALRGQIAARHTCAQKATSDTLIGRAALDSYHNAIRSLASC